METFLASLYTGRYNEIKRNMSAYSVQTTYFTLH